MRVVAIIQARMGSSRLPGKVLMRLANRTVLAHVVQRVKAIEGVEQVIVATTTGHSDDPLVREAAALGVRIFRGSENNVLDRYFSAASEARAEVVIRVTSDCP